MDVNVEKGDFFALLGPNGAGKSTLINILVSLVQKTSGTVRIMGHDIDQDFAGAKAAVGIVPQEFNFSIFETVETIVLNQAGYYGLSRSVAKERAEKYLKQLQLWHKRKAASQTLSGGMKRRLMIARALMHEPRILILDEPTAGVDIEIRRSMWDFLKKINEQGITIILTTHYLEEAETLCRNIAIIDKGSIVANTKMNTLLQTLDHECFILYLAEPVDVVPQIEGYTITLLEDGNLEVEISKAFSLNRLFACFEKHDIIVTSMRNKHNRLEALFLSLTSHGEIS